MLIGINAICINDRPSGAKQRFIGIYTQLFGILNNDEFIIFEPYDCELSKYFSKFNNVKFIKTNIPSEGRVYKNIISYFYWKKIYNYYKFDVFESLHLPIYKINSKKNIITIHDIRGVLNKFHFIGLNFHKIALKNAIKKTDLVITVSNSMKNELVKNFKDLNPYVIYNGIGQLDKIINQEEIIKFKSDYNLNDEYKYILTVGHLEKRKNYFNLLCAFNEIRKVKGEFKLIILGNDSGEMENLKNYVTKNNLINYVIFLKGLSDIEVIKAYKISSLFVFPSYYEGFGIPLIEAMTYGTPYVTSDIDVFKEITENKGVYFDPNDIEDIIKKIILVLNSDKIKNNLVNYGFDRSLDFNYKKLAVKLSELYKK